MLSRGGNTKMGKLEYFIRLALILGIMCFICLFLVKPLTEGFYLTLAGLVICLLITIIGVILTKKRKE